MRTPFPQLSSVPSKHTNSGHVYAPVPDAPLGLLAAFGRSFSAGGGAAGRVGVSSGAVNASAAGGSGSGSCSGNSCSVTLGDSGSRAHVLGTTFGLRAINGDRAALQVDGRDVTCDLKGEISVGALRLTCTAVTDDTATCTVLRG